MKKHMLLLACLLVSNEGFSQTENVHSFYCGSYVNARKQKVSQAEVEAATICAGYVMGVSDTHDMIVALNSSPSFCAPYDVTVGQMVNPVHRYLVGNP
ncbi:MAG: Rap1a/Tai family immunity protein [Gammaproteobacteria bacterium]